MRPINLKITLAILGTLGVMSLIFGISTYSYLKAFELNQEIRESVRIRALVANLKTREGKESVKELQTIRDGIENPERKEALSEVIKAYKKGYASRLSNRMEHLYKVERKYTAFLDPKAAYLEQRIIYFAAIGFFLMAVSLISLRSYIVRKVFLPLKGVIAKMIDFLNGRYSYTFEVPPNDEVGDLQNTFNSMAQRVLQNMEELEALDRAKTEFLNIASHELRTPMTSIKGSLGLVNSGAFGDLNPEVKNMISIAQTETDRLIRLINEILDLAKIESGKMNISLEWTTLGDIVNNSIKGLEGLANAANVKLTSSGDLHLQANVDHDRIQQVITNLVSNAIKFSEPNKTVEVEVRQDGPGPLFVCVIDEGKGIHPDEQAQIFEKFRQATNSETPLVKGTGLGLAIAKAIVEEHQGQIGVQSDPGEGSTFYFTLPKWREVGEFETNEHEGAA